jgi:apolipoprotein N-acyltransferase
MQQHAIPPDSPPSRLRPFQLSNFLTRLRSDAPSLSSAAAALFSAILLAFSFLDFDLWPLAWIALVPLLLVVARQTEALPAFLLGWLFGAVFFFGSCYWLTYSIIHFGGFSPLVAYPMLVPGAVILGIFPAVFAGLLARLVKKFAAPALLLAPALWSPLEWARLEITGQLWNAIGYSQAFHPRLIQTAAWGGVYLVGFLVVLVNAALTLLLLKRNRSAALMTTAALVAVVVIVSSSTRDRNSTPEPQPSAIVIAIQPNVPMDLIKSSAELEQLRLRHFEMSQTTLLSLPNDGAARLLVWPESPMNFTYGTDQNFRDLLTAFAKQHRTSILLNSQETAPNDGVYNSALLINEEGKLAAQYDKIRLLPFGEYVPLPQWMPGAGLIRGIVGDFTPGSNYALMNVGDARAGVFICIEAAYPAISGRFTREGADVLINISNDGYLGPTAVLRQHLANAVLRATENKRPLLRVTNTGITAFIGTDGTVADATHEFQQDVRVWKIRRSNTAASFYAKHGDSFIAGCTLLSLAVILVSFKSKNLRK